MTKTILRQHLKAAYDDIKKSFFPNSSIKISKLFISHPDLDHISEIDKTYLDQNTEVWVNGYIGAAGKKYTSILKDIQKKQCKCIEPLITNSLSGIVVRHPDRPIILEPSFCRLPANYYNAKNKKNNLSPVIEVTIMVKTILFPGDIETVGWLGMAAFLISYQTKSNRLLFALQALGAGLFCLQFCLMHAFSGCFSLVLILLRSLLLRRYKEWRWCRF